MTITYKPTDLRYTDARMAQLHEARKMGMRVVDFAMEFGLNADRTSTKYQQWRRKNDEANI